MIKVNKAIGLKILDWHGGQNTACYSVGSCGLAGFPSEAAVILQAVIELERCQRDARNGDRVQLDGIIGDLRQLIGQASDADAFASFLAANLECAVWADARTDDGDPIDDLPLSETARRSLTKDARAFWTANPACHSDPLQAGHDFHGSRNGHGFGFNDNDWPEDGDALHSAAKAAGEVHLYAFRRKLHLY